MSSPVIPEAILGYRIFQIYRKNDDWKTPLTSANEYLKRGDERKEEMLLLGGLFMDYTWEPGLNIAECLGRSSFGSFGAPGYPTERKCPDNEVPHQDCNCGFQAYFRLGDRVIITPSFFENHAIGLVLGGGRTQIHQDGWRAEKVMIRALLWNPNGTNKKIREIQECVAAKYDVPLFETREAIEKRAEEFGMKVSSYKEIPGIEIGWRPGYESVPGATQEIKTSGAVEEIDILKRFSGETIYRHTDIVYARGYASERQDAEEEAVEAIKKELGPYKSKVLARMAKNNLGAISITWLVGILFLGLGIFLLSQENLILTGLVIVFWLAIFPVIFVKVFEVSDRAIQKQILKPIQGTLAT